jgi:HEPN domain-containing protein
MDSEEKYDHWVKIATRDLNLIDTLYKGGHWLETAFHCQQAIEKLVKGIYNLYR